MNRPRRLRTPSYANVMSTIAVVVAIGTGSAYAAATIGTDEVIDGSLTSVDIADHSLKGDDIKDGKLTRNDLANETLRSNKIQNGTLLGEDIAPEAIGGDKIAPGALTGGNVHEDSLKGDDVDEASLGNVPSASEAAHATSAGHATQAGKAPVEGYQVIYRQADLDQLVDKEEVVDVECPSGKRPLGGGAMGYTSAFNPENSEIAITESYPTGFTYGPDDNRPTGWRVKVEAAERRSYNAAIRVTAYAICAKTDMP